MSGIEGLQFTRAEFDEAPSPASCTTCLNPLESVYFQFNGAIVCPPCCDRLRARHTGGSRVRRFVRATGAGIGAGLAGSGLYYGIVAITGYELSLIAIVVGAMVGKAVQWGSDGRGGWFYQSIAIGLTYLAIVSSYMPFIYSELTKPSTSGKSVAASQAPGRTTSAVSTDPSASPMQPATPNATPGDRPIRGRGLFTYAVMFVVLLVIATAAPFLGGASKIIGPVIIAIGLYEAWKLNRKPPLVLSGPHAIAPPEAAPVAVPQ